MLPRPAGDLSRPTFHPLEERSTMNRLFTAGVLWALSIVGVGAAPEPRIVEHQVNENLYVLYGGQGQGSNVGVFLGEDGIILVDAMVGESHDKLMESIRKISSAPLSLVLATHDHFDHSGGFPHLTRLGANVVARANSEFEETFPWLGFDDKLSISNMGETIEIRGANSHSPSDALIFFERSNVVFMGDAYTSNWFPTFFSGGIEGQLAAIDQVLALANEETVVVPGHGEVVKIDALREYRALSIAWSDLIIDLHDNGLSTVEIAQNPKLLEIASEFNVPNLDRVQLMVERVIETEKQ
jgi:glyoxylase-like metal-dependent hydrolase (beta-lactamase superfamily II)